MPSKKRTEAAAAPAEPDALIGTGYDRMMLANLVMVSRPKAEVEAFDAAAHWVGMPEYDAGKTLSQVIVNFRSREDRDRFLEANGLVIDAGKGGKSTWWPAKEGLDDRKSVLFKG